MSTRTDVGDRLTAALTALEGREYRVLPYAANLGPIPATVFAYVLIDAPTFTPGPRGGSLLASFPIHIVTDLSDPDDSSTLFDTALDDVTTVLDGIPNATWSDAKPDMYDEQKPSYVITATFLSQKG
jgi:hypothetical protein